MADALLEATYFTDPFCSACWAIEPQLLRLREEYDDQVRMTIKMSGLMRSWKDFEGDLKQYGGPEHIAAFWDQMAQSIGMPMEGAVWREDPPASTWPSNMAYRAAVLQGESLASRYLRRMREAVLTERKNLARPEILKSLAEEVGLDPNRLWRDMNSEPVARAFYEDMVEARSFGSAIPIVVFKNTDGESRTFVGYTEFAEWVVAADRLSKGAIRSRDPRPLESLIRNVGRITSREVGEVYGWVKEEAEAVLADRVASGLLRVEPAPNGAFYCPAAGG